MSQSVAAASGLAWAPRHSTDREAAAPRTLLWVNHFAVTGRDGGGTRHAEIGRALGAHGWTVQVAASDFHLHTRSYTRRGGAHARDVVVEESAGVHFHWLWSAPYAANDWRRLRNWLTFARGVAALRPVGARPDIVIGSSPQLLAALAALRLARRLGVPFVLEVRDLWPESMLAAGGRRGPFYAALAALARHLYARSDAIIVLARGTAAYLQRLGVPAERLVYIPNGVDLDAFDGGVERPAAPFTVVYAGAHGPANGLEVVLDAAERLRDVADVRFLFVGDGPVRPALAADAARRRLANVEFRDPVGKAAIPALLGGASAGLMVLRDAPLFTFAVSPNKLFDYLAAALPVVCNVRGEVAAMLSESGAGVQAGDSSGQALAEAVLRLRACSADERRRMGLAGREWVAREHARPVLAARLDAALRHILGA